ncbi:MAG: MGMT family protein [Elusimicrobiales bacterium]|nr:MGMT family protein [Elusimicrobiales bacterium]MCK5358195.1 MGMT family protein [Elusimicrobiales bacterium]MCK5583779.1 MGMT family protein [Elusimicrobiales bacterium]
MKKISQKILRDMKKHPLFFQKVWLACSEIPAGQTRSYKQIAIKIGTPKAYRAVGTALKRNPFAPIIPCHRVIKSDGTAGGYSGKNGIRGKIKLLKKEKLK